MCMECDWWGEIGLTIFWEKILKNWFKKYQEIHIWGGLGRSAAALHPVFGIDAKSSLNRLRMALKSQLLLLIAYIWATWDKFTPRMWINIPRDIPKWIDKRFEGFYRKDVLVMAFAQPWQVLEEPRHLRLLRHREKTKKKLGPSDCGSPS